MAFNSFLMLDGIIGESTDAQHPGAVQVLSWSWGSSQSINIGGSASGAGAGKASFADLSLMIQMDSSTVHLFKQLASGTLIPSAMLYIVKAGMGPATFLTIKMTEVFVSSLQISASSEVPSVSLSIKYGSISMQYTPQTSTGTAGTPITEGWNVIKNTHL